MHARKETITDDPVSRQTLTQDSRMYASRVSRWRRFAAWSRLAQTATSGHWQLASNLRLAAIRIGAPTAGDQERTAILATSTPRVITGNISLRTPAVIAGEHAREFRVPSAEAWWFRCTKGLTAGKCGDWTIGSVYRKSTGRDSGR
jgi:hypothetical protein